MFNMFLRVPLCAVVRHLCLSGGGKQDTQLLRSTATHFYWRPPCRPVRQLTGVLLSSCNAAVVDLSEKGLFVYSDICLVVYSSQSCICINIDSLPLHSPGICLLCACPECHLGNRLIIPPG